MYLKICAWYFVLKEKKERKMAVKCLLCKQSYRKRDLLKKHYVEHHSVPENEDVMERYLNLRFTKSEKGWARHQNMLVRLAKLLKARVVRHAVNRKKIKLNSTTVENLLYDYVQSNDDMESVMS